jgi:16S rRNA G527 N7-methylase RsmG
MDDFREFLKGLPGKLSAKNIEAITARVEAMMPPEMVKTVEIINARVPTATIEAFGLTIAVDAHGHAVTVEFPYGAEVTE